MPDLATAERNRPTKPSGLSPSLRVTKVMFSLSQQTDGPCLLQTAEVTSDLRDYITIHEHEATVVGVSMGSVVSYKKCALQFA